MQASACALAPTISDVLQALSACAGCHDLTRTGDPVRACMAPDGAARIDLCLDEHQRPGEALGSRGTCAHQHGEGRFLAWEAARRVLDATPARDAMSRPARTVGPEVLLDDAVRLLVAGRINRLPVVSNGKVVGIVTRTDLLSALTTSVD